MNLLGRTVEGVQHDQPPLSRGEGQGHRRIPRGACGETSVRIDHVFTPQHTPEGVFAAVEARCDICGWSGRLDLDTQLNPILRTPQEARV